MCDVIYNTDKSVSVFDGKTYQYFTADDIAEMDEMLFLVSNGYTPFEAHEQLELLNQDT